MSPPSSPAPSLSTTTNSNCHLDRSPRLETIKNEKNNNNNNNNNEINNSSSSYRTSTLEHLSKKIKTTGSSTYNDRRVSEWRITELLEHNLQSSLEAKKEATETTSCDCKNKRQQQQQQPKPGEIASLALRQEVFMGVRVEWPFPEMMRPQRQMCMHIIKALKESRQVVWESPTGTAGWVYFHDCGKIPWGRPGVAAILTNALWFMFTGTIYDWR
jgi:hypothetical protein